MIDTSIDSSNFYFCVAIIQGIVLSFIILNKRPYRKPSLFLGLLIFLFSLSLLHLVLEESIHAFNSRFPIPMEFSLALGPLAYLHVFYLLRPNQKFNLRHLIHFLPTLLFDGLLFVIVFTYIRSHEEWASANIVFIQTLALIFILFSVIQLSIYTFLIYTQIKYFKSISKEYLTLQKWLKMILVTWIIIIVILVLVVSISLMNIKILDENSHLFYKPMGVITGLCIYILGYFYLLKFISPINTYYNRVKRIKFSEDEIQQKKSYLLETIKKNQLYKDNSLTVKKLAKSIEWPINDVSFVINEALFTNFNDLVNNFRLQAFKELINESDNKKYSILGLAEDAGFSSKASFYRVFKKETGLTPSQYLKSSQL